MSFVSNISSRLLAVMDFGSENATVLVAERKKDRFEPVGAGVAPARGIERGRVVRLADASESVFEAFRKAEESAGTRLETLYYNLNDPLLESRKVTGARILRGDGEIQASDVSEACRSAERSADDFEKKSVYSRSIGFLIDDRDRVSQPVGVFGRKLEVTQLVLLAQAAHCESWSRVMDRARVPQAVPILSAWSSACGVLGPEERKRKTLIVDAGKDFLDVMIFGDNRVRDLRSAAVDGLDEPAAADLAGEAAASLWTSDPGAEELLLTGDLAASEEFSRCFSAKAPAAPVMAPTLGLDRFEHPKYAALVGLLSLAGELDGRRSLLIKQKGRVAMLRERAAAWINEYF